MTTIAYRICPCGTLLGIELWPWNGEAWTVSHGFCHECRDRFVRLFEEVEAA